MLRRLAARFSLALLGLGLCASFATPEHHALELDTRSAAYRVSRHFAAGLEYLLIEPRELPEDAELPMVVYLHGRSSVPTPPNQAFYDLETPVRVIMPRGPARSGAGYAWMPVSARGGETPELTGALVENAARLARAMGEWRQRHPTRGRPIVMGFSQGGMLTMELALHHPEAISAAIPLAGWVPPTRMPARRDPYGPAIQIRGVHGSADPILSASRSVSVVRRLEALGYPADIEVVRGARHEMTLEMRELARERLQDALSRLPSQVEGRGNS
ncbi:MAG: alpha/beta hydrolase [Sandaracinaceae bacterium]